GECVDVNGRHGFLHGTENFQISLTCEVWVDAALEAYLRSAACPSFLNTGADLVEIQQIWFLRPVAIALALGESAKAATVAADIRVVDVTVHDVGGGVAHGGCAHVVGCFADGREVAVTRLEQPRHIGLADAVRALAYDVV